MAFEVRTCRLDPRLRWVQMWGDIYPIIDDGLLDWAGVADAPHRAMINGGMACWYGEEDPVFLKLVFSLSQWSFENPLTLACSDGRKLLLVWRDRIPTGQFLTGTREWELGVEWLVADSMTLDLRGREEFRAAREAPAPPKSPGYIYVLRGKCTPPVYKIGRTSSIPTRFRTLSTLTPFETEVLHVIQTDWAPQCEAYFHRLFRDKRLNGEWFRLEPRDVGFLLEHKEFRPSAEGRDYVEALCALFE